MINKIQNNNQLITQNQNNCCSNVCNTFIQAIKKLAAFFRNLFLSIFCCSKAQKTTPPIANPTPIILPPPPVIVNRPNPIQIQNRVPAPVENDRRPQPRPPAPFINFRPQPQPQPNVYIQNPRPQPQPDVYIQNPRPQPRPNNQRADIVAISPEAIQEAANLRLTHRAKTTCPPLPQQQANPDIDAIPINELLDHYDRLFPAGYDRLFPAEQRNQLTRANVQELINFVNNRRMGDRHRTPQYTADIQLGIRFLLAEMRKPEISDDTKRGVFFSITSFLDDDGCHPRRYEDIYNQVDHLRNGGPDLDSNVIIWNATDKEEVLSRCCLRSGIHPTVIMHHTNKARRDMGREWGLKQDPAALQDPYIAQYAQRRTLNDYRQYLERYYTPACMIQKTKERLSLPNNFRLFNAEITRRQNDLPDNWAATLYEPDGLTPSYAGVAYMLRAMGFLENRN